MFFCPYLPITYMLYGFVVLRVEVLRHLQISLHVSHGRRRCVRVY